MHSDKNETKLNQATDSDAGCATSTQTARIMSHAEEQMLEQDAKNALYRAVAQFVMEPTQVNGTMIDLYGNQYRDAWMRGRRRVMD
jgi:hypothetical protein